MAGAKMGEWALRKLWTTPDGVQHQDWAFDASLPPMRRPRECQPTEGETPGTKAGRMTLQWLLEQESEEIHLDAHQTADLIAILNTGDAVWSKEAIDVFSGQPVIGRKAGSGFPMLGRFWEQAA